MANPKPNEPGPGKPLRALWLLEHADSPDVFVVANESPRIGSAGSYLAMDSLQAAREQVSYQTQHCGIISCPVKFDIVRSSGNTA